MKLHSSVHDCLYINWAIDLERAPELPPGLSYDHRAVAGKEICFASLLLFRQRGLHWVSLPWLPVSHPQANLRLYVVDRDHRPAVLFLALWVPGWVSGLMRTLGGVPAQRAKMDFPDGPVLPGAQGCWSVRCGECFQVETRPGGVAGRELGSWTETVDFFRRREVGYLTGKHGLRQVNAAQPDADAVPVSVSIADASLARRSMGDALEGRPVQSSFLCETLPLELELSPAAAGQGV